MAFLRKVCAFAAIAAQIEVANCLKMKKSRKTKNAKASTTEKLGDIFEKDKYELRTLKDLTKAKAVCLYQRGCGIKFAADFDNARAVKRTETHYGRSYQNRRAQTARKLTVLPMAGWQYFAEDGTAIGFDGNLSEKFPSFPRRSDDNSALPLVILRVEEDENGLWDVPSFFARGKDAKWVAVTEKLSLQLAKRRNNWFLRASDFVSDIDVVFEVDWSEVKKHQ